MDMADVRSCEKTWLSSENTLMGRESSAFSNHHCWEKIIVQI